MNDQEKPLKNSECLRQNKLKCERIELRSQGKDWKTEKSQFERTGQDDLKQTKVCIKYKLTKEFDPGSGRTLAARLTHASRTELNESLLLFNLVADGWVTREQPAFKRGITVWKDC